MTIITVSDVEARLVDLGVPFAQMENKIIQFSIDKITNFIKMETAQNEIPSEAYEVAIEMIVSDFISTKMAFGLIDPNDPLPVIQAEVKSIRDGDTNVTYAVADSGGAGAMYTFGWIIGQYAHANYDWSAWRRLRW